MFSPLIIFLIRTQLCCEQSQIIVKKSPEGVLTYHSQVEHVVVDIVVLFVDVAYLHTRGEHLLPLGCAEVDGFVWVFLEKTAVDEACYLEAGLGD